MRRLAELLQHAVDGFVRMMAVLREWALPPQKNSFMQNAVAAGRRPDLMLRP